MICVVCQLLLFVCHLQAIHSVCCCLALVRESHESSYRNHIDIRRYTSTSSMWKNLVRSGLAPRFRELVSVATTILFALPYVSEGPQEQTRRSASIRIALHACATEAPKLRYSGAQTAYWLRVLCSLRFHSACFFSVSSEESDSSGGQDGSSTKTLLLLPPPVPPLLLLLDSPG